MWWLVSHHPVPQCLPEAESPTRPIGACGRVVQLLAVIPALVRHDVYPRCAVADTLHPTDCLFCCMSSAISYRHVQARTSRLINRFYAKGVALVRSESGMQSVVKLKCMDSEGHVCVYTIDTDIYKNKEI